jgi:GxxExxY protein
VDFRYKEMRFRQDYRVDLLVEDRLVVEVKSVDRLLPIHRAQLLTYLRLLDLRLGLLLNFNVEVLAKGVRRVVNGY